MKEYLITHPSQLNSLSMTPLKRVMSVGRLRLIGTIANHEKHHEWEAKLNKYYYTCGCDTGAKALIVGFLIGVAWSVFNLYKYHYSLWKLIIWVFGFSVMTSVIGKYLGLYIANKKMKKVINEIQDQWLVEDLQQKEKVYFSC